MKLKKNKNNKKQQNKTKQNVINAISVDPDQTPRSALSDLGLHCLPMSNLLDARHKWVKTYVVYGKPLMLSHWELYSILRLQCIY